MNFKLRIWRQKNAQEKGRLETYQIADISPDTSFLEMLDLLNEQLVVQDIEPVAFDHDCREGICGMCGLVINGVPNWKRRQKVTVCQIHMRVFRDGETITIEPWRANAFPVIKDLIVDRSALDRIIQAGGFVSVPTGNAADAHTSRVHPNTFNRAMDAAACIGCGACVAVCPNASAILFTAAKTTHLALLPQGQPERYERAIRLAEAMDREWFGGCTNIGECTAVCPKGIQCSNNVTRLNQDFVIAHLLKGKRKRS